MAETLLFMVVSYSINCLRSACALVALQVPVGREEGLSIIVRGSVCQPVCLRNFRVWMRLYILVLIVMVVGDINPELPYRRLLVSFRLLVYRLKICNSCELFHF